jgi:OOP family OmpA-OmpF porin
MNKTTRLSLALVLATLALPATAVTETRPYIFGGYNYIFQDDDRNSDNGEGYSFGAGKALNKYWGMEFGGFYNNFDSDGTGAGQNFRELGGEIDALFFYSRERAFQPYVTLGAGAMRNKLKNAPGAPEDTDPFGALGVGFFKYFGDDSRLGMRADVRYRWTDTDLAGESDFAEPIARIHLVAALGPKPEDQRASGGPDSDGDGVPDEADLCPNTPKGVRVDDKGCPIDSDGDGVPDALDKCPGTAKGVKVGADGCPKEGVGEGPNRRFEDVHFEFDKSDLTDYARAILDKASKAIGGLQQQYPSLKVDVSGHTDWIGTDAYNQALSERRANSVKQYLLRKGVDSKRINTYAYGETKPVASNESDEGRAQNRRAEVRTRGQ